jgi:hypothetical protein
LKILALSLLLALSGCGVLQKAAAPGPSALVIANCPELGPVTDKSFGTTVQVLVETSIQYNKCRAAAMAGK